MLISELKTLDKVYHNYIKLKANKQTNKQIIKFIVYFSLWIHNYLLLYQMFWEFCKMGLLWHWLFLAPVVWNGITEAKSSCSTSLSKCLEDSWRGGHQPANMSQCPSAPGGGQPPATHCHSAVQHHAGKCNCVSYIISLSNLTTQIAMKTILYFYPFFIIQLLYFPVCFSPFWLHILGGVNIFDDVIGQFTHQTFMVVLSSILKCFL